MPHHLVIVLLSVVLYVSAAHAEDGDLLTEHERALLHMKTQAQILQGASQMDLSLATFEPAISAHHLRSVDPEVVAAAGDGDSFNDWRPLKEEVVGAAEEDVLNAWREEQNLPPVKLRKVNGITYAIPLRHPTRVLQRAKLEMSPEDYAEFEKEYQAEAVRKSEARIVITRLSLEYDHHLIELHSVQKKIQHLTDKLASLQSQ